MATAVGTSEPGHRLRPHLGQSPCQPAFPFFRARENKCPDHLGPHGEIIDMPAQRLVAACMALQPGAEIPLCAADISVQAWPEGDRAELPDSNFAGTPQLKKSDVDAGGWQSVGIAY